MTGLCGASVTKAVLLCFIGTYLYALTPHFFYLSQIPSYLFLKQLQSLFFFFEHFYINTSHSIFFSNLTLPSFMEKLSPSSLIKDQPRVSATTTTTLSFASDFYRKSAGFHWRGSSSFQKEKEKKVELYPITVAEIIPKLWNFISDCTPHYQLGNPMS